MPTYTGTRLQETCYTSFVCHIAGKRKYEQTKHLLSNNPNRHVQIHEVMICEKICIVMAHWRLTASSQCAKSLTLLRCLHYSLDDQMPCTFHAISFSSNCHCLCTKRVTKSSYRWLLFSASFHFYTRASLVSTSLCGCFFLKTPKTPLINTAKPVKCRIRSAGVEADIIVHSRRLVRNVHCDWLKIAVRFLNATNQISRFWHTLKREIWRCDPREDKCSAIERGSPTMVSPKVEISSDEISLK